MKRLIVDYKKLTKDILDLLVSQYPYGFDDEDVIIEFTSASGEIVKAVKVNAEDTIYLVKIGSKLQQAIKQHEDTIFEEEDDFIDFDNPINEDEDLEDNL
ncbi:hypothetical protein OAP99_01215 [Flavobacteriaceae bacterium]|nr:hypothetical protein [Flavobacteriaceae bacterium]MDC1060790.1 hypothetical protein [Flavobacteriaceae bacterium]